MPHEMSRAEILRKPGWPKYFQDLGPNRWCVVGGPPDPCVHCDQPRLVPNLTCLSTDFPAQKDWDAPIPEWWLEPSPATTPEVK